MKRQEIEEFLHHEMNTHLIPNTILFVPGDETHPPTHMEETETPILASLNMFAAVGLAYQLKKPTIWAVHHTAGNDDTYKVVDLRTRTGRDQAQIENGSEIALRSTASHLIKHSKTPKSPGRKKPP
jgi:hypothetical protein